MALQIRRGLEANLPASPADGELLYATDTNKLYVGDSGTAQEISGGSGGGLGNVVDDATPELGGNLDVNGRKIVSTSNGNIEIDPNGTGNIILHGNLTIDSSGNFTKTGLLNISSTSITSFGNDTTLVDGNVTITRNSYGATPGTGFLFAQHHEVADAVNFTFFRSRGTGLARTSVANNDDLADVTFIGFDGTNAIGAGSITCSVDGTVNLGRVPGRFRFSLHNGITPGVNGLLEVAELNSAGVLKVNSIANLGGTSISLTAPTINMIGNVQLNAQNDLRFADSDSSNYIGFQAPSTITANVLWTLPATDGISGQVLSTDGAGTLSWATTGGGGTLSSRATTSGTASALLSGSSANLDVTGFKGYILYKIETNVAAWVRLYTDTASRTTDSTRLEGDDPLPGAGVIAEIITTGSSTILISPGALGFNNENSPTNNIPVRVTNKSGATTDVIVTLTVLQLEA